MKNTDCSKKKLELELYLHIINIIYILNGVPNYIKYFKQKCSY